LELAKTESSLFEYDNQIFDVVNASRVICKDIEHQDLSKNLVWKFEASEISKKTIFSDEGAISLILRNILEVSSSMTDIGFISVKLSYPTRDIVLDRGFEVPENEDDYNEKKYLMFTISDTSSGYSDVELEDIFDPYLQVDKPNKKNIIRFIALASAKNVVNHLKGDIWVESTLMQGSTYNVIIPIAR
jgi:signal transduction histidine kinase